jgi:arylsulfatase A-like enzyme
MPVPLIIRAPGLGRGRRVDAQVAHLDVLPTALDLLDVRAALSVQGRSLRPLLAGDTLPERPVIGEAAHASSLVAVRTNRWKYLRNRVGRERLYDLVADPGERVDVCDQEREQCASLRGVLRRWEREVAEARTRVASPPVPEATIDEQTTRRLRAQGYVD